MPHLLAVSRTLSDRSRQNLVAFALSEGEDRDQFICWDADGQVTYIPVEAVKVIRALMDDAAVNRWLHGG